MNRTLKFWADIDNAPHVPVLYPLIRKLEALGHTVQITARDYGQTIPLLELYGLEYHVLGKHGGKNILFKVLSFFTRSLQLLFFAIGKRFSLVFCHGTRAVYVPAKLLGIPLVVLFDYEYASSFPSFIRNWVSESMVPYVISDDVLRNRGSNLAKCRKYPGLKEELYVYNYLEDPSLLTELGISESKIIVLVRPPATMAHYYIEKSGQCFDQVLTYFLDKEEVHVILIPRTAKQRADIEEQLRKYSAKNVTIPDRVYFGPTLLHSADVVVSGGGTMNREAACLGVPVYSIYAGPLGGVDRYLIRTGRLGLISEVAQLQNIPLRKRQRQIPLNGHESQQRLVNFIIERLLSNARRIRGHNGFSKYDSFIEN